MSVNIIEGPVPSSVATRVMGTGLLENLGLGACRDRVGRSEPTEDGRALLAASGMGSLSGSVSDRCPRDDSLRSYPALETLAALGEEGRLEMIAAF